MSASLPDLILVMQALAAPPPAGIELARARVWARFQQRADEAEAELPALTLTTDSID